MCDISHYRANPTEGHNGQQEPVMNFRFLFTSQGIDWLLHSHANNIGHFGITKIFIGRCSNAIDPHLAGIHQLLHRGDRAQGFDPTRRMYVPLFPMAQSSCTA